ncbi:MAG: glycosyltransferase [Betaproteobacteria bacterium]|nr:glycosyltransferase [Betaproteobacteria bacterium]
MFSVIMPAWNRSGVVGRAIESVLAQTWTDFELLIIDDGSDDELPAAVSAYDDPRIRLHRFPHRGVSAARNSGLALATRPYLAYLDSDNTWRPGFLVAFHELFSTRAPRPEAAYCMARRQVHGAARSFAAEGPVGDSFSLRRLRQGNYIDINTFVHSRRCLDVAGWFDESLRRFVDWDLIARVGILTEPAFIPEVMVDYHLGLVPDTITCSDAPISPVAAKVAHVLQDVGRRVEIEHDTVVYAWDALSDRRYDNWLRMQQPLPADDGRQPLAFPYMLQVEPTSACNLSCQLCPVAENQLGRPTRHLPLADFKTLVDDMQDHLLLLVLWDWGEPLLNPDLPKMVRYATDRDIRTVTSTNAHLLARPGLAEALLEAGLSTLIVALDSVDATRYARFRRGGSLSQALDGLKALVAAKQRLGAGTLIHARTVVTRTNEAELSQLRRLSISLGADHFSVKTLNPSCGENDMDDELVPENPRYRRYEYEPGSWRRLRDNTPCERPWRMANILSSGAVVPCCYDFDQSMPAGNIAAQPFTHVWTGESFASIRRRIRGQQQTLPKCRNCGVNFRLSATGWFVRGEGSRPQMRFSMSGRSAAKIAPLLHEGVLLSEFARQFENLQRSRSWRMTAPLRAGSDLARYLVGQLRKRGRGRY